MTIPLHNFRYPPGKHNETTQSQLNHFDAEQINRRKLTARCVLCCVPLSQLFLTTESTRADHRYHNCECGLMQTASYIPWTTLLYGRKSSKECQPISTAFRTLLFSSWKSTSQYRNFVAPKPRRDSVGTALNDSLHWAPEDAVVPQSFVSLLSASEDDSQNAWGFVERLNMLRMAS